MNIKGDLGNPKSGRKLDRQGRQTGLKRKRGRKTVGIAKLFVHKELVRLTELSRSSPGTLTGELSKNIDVEGV